MILKKFIAPPHLGNAHFIHAPAFHDADAVRHLRRHETVVAGHENRATSVAMLGEKCIDQRHPAFVQRGVRFVQKQYGWTPQHCPGKSQTLFHAAGKHPHPGHGEIPQPHPFQHRPAGVLVWLRAMQPDGKIEILERRQLIVMMAAVGDHGKQLSRRIALCDAIRPAQKKARATRPLQRGQYPQQRGLAGAVGAEQRGIRRSGYPDKSVAWKFFCWTRFSLRGGRKMP